MWSQNTFASSFGAHSRNSSVSSATSFHLREQPEQVEPEGHSGNRSCKIFALVYLAGCIIVSAVYVVAYGKNQHVYFYSEEVWVPGTVNNIPLKPKVEPLLFTDEPYTEWMSQRWTYFNSNFSNWPALPEYIDTIQQLAAGTVDEVPGVWILTNSKLYFAQNISAPSSAHVQFIAISELLHLQVREHSQIAVSEGKVYLFTPLNITLLDCTPPTIEYCDIVTTTSNTSNITAVYSLAFSESNNTLWAGTDVGLFYVTLTADNELDIALADAVEGPVQTLAWRPSLTSLWSTHPHPFAFGSASIETVKPVRSRCHPRQQRCEEPFGLLAVGTRRRIYFYDGSMWWFEWVSVWIDGKGGLVDGSPTSMLFVPTGELFISNNVSLTRVNIDYTFDRIGPLQGLPYNQINALHFSSYATVYPPVGGGGGVPGRVAGSAGTVWVGTEKGYALYDVGDQTFKGYFFGPRWHSGGSILGFAGCCGQGAVVLSDQGISVVKPEEWTLQRKAAHYQAMLERHTRAPGLVADCPLTDYIPSTCSPQTSDNDGLWTSLLVVAESLRYQVTKDPQAQSNAWALFKGMKFLNDVTGIQGLMARSVVTNNVSVGDEWHNSTAIPGWLWKGDTSSDEMVGHMFAYPLVHDLVASTQDQKNEVSTLVDSIVGYIKNNSYYLIDVTNRPTTWGVWAPHPINLNLSWADQHGINALQIVSYLLSAYRLTGKVEYLDAWKELFNNGTLGSIPTHYGLNLINQKITFPRDNNFSDDELAFLPYFVYFYSVKGLESKIRGAYSTLLADMVIASINRTWRYVRPERSSAWAAIYSYATGARDPSLIEDLVWNLRTWPLELIEWETLNSHRLDITFNPEQDRNLQSNTQSVRVLPANERTQLRWNGNPYQLDCEGSSSETDPGAWLMPYWFARWLKLL